MEEVIAIQIQKLKFAKTDILPTSAIATGPLPEMMLRFAKARRAGSGKVPAASLPGFCPSS
ncbi:hypothetical protein CO656_26780 [Sinorhizobium sp. FG01]|uniref:Uncharacterized protein n=1 Tax=Sinorhizobium americanum TaxID=194963 RepID=A0A2S3YQN7_9HYPH|nr:hypothetical protein CO656_26780 [Sinorhizobium sp. FG01]POH33603.1 hypothetical protein ATY31_10160 [Sinorhizobium americanum]